MTTDLAHAVRALDAVDPPDQWGDIVRRSADGDEHGDLVELPAAGGRRGRSRRVLAVAAVLLVVAGIAGAIALVRADGDQAPTTDPGPRVVTSSDDPAGIWGHEWQLVDIQTGDAAVRDPMHAGDGKPPRLDLRTEGRFAITACNRWTGRLDLRGDVLQVGEPTSTAAACSDPLEDLVALLFRSPSRVELRGSQLVLTQIPDPRTDGEAPRARGPQLRYTFVLPGALTLRQQFWGRSWQVTEIADGDRPWEPVPEGQVAPIDAVTVGRIALPECGNPWSLFEANDLEQQGDWSVWHGSCPYGPQDRYLDLIRAVLSGSPDATVTEDAVQITGPAGSLRARSVPVATARQPERFFDDRWVVVAAFDGDERITVPGDLYLRPAEDGRSVSLKPCGREIGGPSQLVTEDGTTRLRIDGAGAGPLAECRGIGADMAAYFEDLFGREPELHMHGNRATLSVPGKRVVLVQIGPI